MKNTLHKHLTVTLVFSILLVALASCQTEASKTSPNSTETEENTIHSEFFVSQNNDRPSDTPPSNSYEFTISRLALYSPLKELIFPAHVDSYKITNINFFLLESISLNTEFDLPDNLPQIISLEAFGNIMAGFDNAIKTGELNELAKQKFCAYYALKGSHRLESISALYSSIYYPVTEYTPIFCIDLYVTKNEAKDLSELLNKIGYNSARCKEDTDALHAIAEKHNTVIVQTFYDGSTVESVVIEEGISVLTNLPDFSNLKTISLPTSIKYVEVNFFGLFEKLEAIEYAGTKSQWQSIEIFHEYDNYESIQNFETPVDVTVKCTDGDIVIKAYSFSNPENTEETK